MLRLDSTYASHQCSQKTLSATLTSVLFFAIITSSAVPSLAVPENETATFTLDKWNSGDLAPTSPKSLARSSRAQSSSGAQSSSAIQVATLNENESTIIDSSLTKRGALLATGTDYVDLSWENLGGGREFHIFRNDALIARTTDDSLRDGSVQPGFEYEYRIETVLPEGASPSEDEATIRGFSVMVPVSTNYGDEAQEREQTLAVRAAYSGSTVRYRTFIPEAKIKAPNVGCGNYKGNQGYQFAGDNRGFAPSKGTSKTSLNANIRWDGRGMIGSSKSIGSTKLYKNGKLHSTKTASSKDVWVKQLGKTKNDVDLRFSVKATNPFCPKFNSIQGVFTITVTKNGSYGIISGSHRQMPNHEIYVSSIVGGWKTVYQRKHGSATCLVAGACPEARISGSGKY